MASVILGGAQTDFARNWAREGLRPVDLIRECVASGLEAAGLDATEIGSIHVGNFVGELLANQGHLGGLVSEAVPELAGVPASRHEAACASGSIAALSAMTDLESGRYGITMVLGLEWMREAGGLAAGEALGVAALTPDEVDGITYPWPHLFNELAVAYDERYGLDEGALRAIGAKNLANAKRNPNAQTRSWAFTDASFDTDDDANPVVCGKLRKHDCSQITDGAAVLFLATETAAAGFARRRGLDPTSFARITGWGHRVAPLSWATKLADARDDAFLLPWTHRAIAEAYARAGISGVEALDLVETHDCFTITELVAMEAFGLADPGTAAKLVGDGVTAADGALPFNPSGGLIGGGHPVGATGVRMLLDATKQVTAAAGDAQVPGARTAATLNIGGSATTSCCFVVQR